MEAFHQSCLLQDLLSDDLTIIDQIGKEFINHADCLEVLTAILDDHGKELIDGAQNETLIILHVRCQRRLSCIV